MRRIWVLFSLTSIFTISDTWLVYAFLTHTTFFLASFSSILFSVSVYNWIFENIIRRLPSGKHHLHTHTHTITLLVECNCVLYSHMQSIYSILYVLKLNRNIREQQFAALVSDHLQTDMEYQIIGENSIFSSGTKCTHLQRECRKSQIYILSLKKTKKKITARRK